MTNSLPEVWLRGPVPGVPSTLQPVAHAVLQAREEVEAMMKGFPDQKLWDRPAGVASPGFHLQHLSAVLSRLFTYARGESLTSDQLKALKAEGTPPHAGVTSQELVEGFGRQVDRTIDELRATDERTLTEPRTVGRNKLPSTRLGLLVHAAEHTERHVGRDRADSAYETLSFRWQIRVRNQVLRNSYSSQARLFGTVLVTALAEESAWRPSLRFRPRPVTPS